MTRALAAILCATLACTGCSFKTAKDAASSALGLKVILQDKHPASSTPASKGSPFAIFSGPSGFSDFSCFIVNVTGQGISASSRAASCTLSGAFAHSGTGQFSSPTRLGSAIQFLVPPGSARNIEAYGLYPPTVECGGSPNLTAGVYFLGAVTQDLFTDAAVTIPASYAAGTGSELSCVPPSPVTPSCSAGASWSTSDDQIYASSANNQPNGMAFDSAGNYYVVGAGNNPSIYHWLVKKSTNKGATWTTIQDYQLQSGYNSVPQAAGFDGLGNMFVVGNTQSASNNYWQVMMSSNGGSSFTVSDQFQYTPSNLTQAYSVGFDSSQNIYVSGVGQDASAHIHWLVRKSADHGSTWNTVQDYQLDSTHDSTARSLVVDGSNNIWVAGDAEDASGVRHWIVYTSPDGGTTWNQKDNYSDQAGSDSIGYGIAVSSSGIVYAAGLGTASGGYWVVRKSTDSGSTWTVVDNYQSGTSVANAIVVDSYGSIFVSGSTAGTSSWQVRMSKDTGGTWTTVDTQTPLSGGATAYATAMSVDSLGNVFSLGGRSNASVVEWLVRESVCQ